MRRGADEEINKEIRELKRRVQVLQNILDTVLSFINKLDERVVKLEKEMGGRECEG